MGGCNARDGKAFGAFGGTNVVEPKMRQPEGSPRDVKIVAPVETENAVMRVGFEGTSPRAWSWQAGVLKLPLDENQYRPLSLEEAPEEDEDDLPRRYCSKAQLEWVDHWLESVESGELDVYTCLGLSNMFTWSPDTRKLIVKVTAVTVLQVVIPVIMLVLETAEGLTLEPATSNKGFRIIGSALYLYSVYSMYNNALDECRSRLLNFAFRYNVPVGIWLPLVLGEFSNVLVSMVLVVTLYVIFTHLIQPADLILNAVAVNFLGSVDGEFVNEDMKKDALKNFKELTNDVLSHQTEEQKHASEDGEKVGMMDVFLKMLLYSIIAAGITLSVLFFFSGTNQEFNATLQPSGKGHTGGGHVHTKCHCPKCPT